MVYIKRIDEPDFGCEGVPDNAVITDRLTFVIDGDEKTIDVPEKIVWKLKIDDNMEISDELYNKILKFSK